MQKHPPCTPDRSLRQSARPRISKRTAHWKTRRQKKTQFRHKARFRLPALHRRFEGRHDLRRLAGLVRQHDEETRFVPMPKKAAIRIYHKAVEWNRRGKLAGCHGGLIGSHVLLVLHTLIFDFLNHAHGPPGPVL